MLYIIVLHGNGGIIVPVCSDFALVLIFNIFMTTILFVSMEINSSQLVPFSKNCLHSLVFCLHIKSACFIFRYCMHNTKPSSRPSTKSFLIFGHVLFPEFPQKFLNLAN